MNIVIYEGTERENNSSIDNLISELYDKWIKSWINNLMIEWCKKLTKWVYDKWYKRRPMKFYILLKKLYTLISLMVVRAK